MIFGVSCFDSENGKMETAFEGHETCRAERMDETVKLKR
jgi:hypothetical protein